MLSLHFIFFVHHATLATCRAAITLEYDFATTLDFGGVASTEAAAAISRADKGGTCSASQLRAVVTVVVAADRLRKQVGGECR